MIDTSALIAILLDEPEAPDLAARIAGASHRRCSAVTMYEASVVIETRRGTNGLARLDLLVSEAGIAIEPFTANDARAARRAYRRFGKGLHPASLNFNDCVAYALAVESGEPLLFIGNDFAQTGVIDARAAS